MRRSLLAVAVLAAVLPVAAACSDSGGTTGSSASVTSAAGGTATDEQVQWVDKLCGEVVELAEAQTTAPPDLQGSDPMQTMQAFDTYISDNIAAMDQTIEGLRDLGASPIDGADTAVDALVTGLEALKTSYESTKDKFASVDANDQAAVQSAIVEAFAGLSAGGEEFGKAFEAVGANQAIEDAGDNAPNCQKLDTVGSSATPTS